MTSYSQTGFNPYNMYQNWGYGYQYPAFRGVQNSPQAVSVPQPNVNLQTPPDTVSSRATEYIQTKHKKEGLSTGAKWVIGIGVATALTIGADFLFCKGKHIKNLWGKLKGNNSKPKDTPPRSTKSDAVKSTVKPEKTAKKVIKDEIGNTIEKNYDANGKLSNEITKYTDGRSKEVFYDANGKVSKHILKDSAGKISEETEFIREAKGNKIKKITKYADGRSDEMLCDANGKVSKHIFKDSAGKISEEIEYIYDAKGNKIKEITKYADGRSKEFFYDANNRPTRDITKDANGKIKLETIYTYDTNGKFLKKVTKDADGNIIT